MGVQGRSECGGGETVPSIYSGERATVLGEVGFDPGEPPFLVPFPNSNQQAFTKGL